MFNLSDVPGTTILLILNVLVSGYALFGDGSVIDRFALRPRSILQGRQYYRLITSGFVHAGLGHLAFNMMTLFFFGPEIERLLGTPRFLLLYFGSELASNGFSLLLNKNNAYYSAVGASGAISGVLFGFCLFYPLQKIYIFLIPVGIPAFIFAIGYVLVSIYAMKQGRQEGQVGGIAHEAHLGGAIAGLVLTILLEPRSIQIFLSNFGG